ncbi:hypothetical protein M758_3G259600 [Ceratodon purpureus]|uniref:Protein ENHANCED DISEASE RESISTANCE 2 C-terminal domain-containing protein n=1 Tax=Ceratodon purpureus TaxID=3225 RepID=A0A8T0IMX4_CERPU|nr:hypothetical protein KC19_3G259100 [Ceratodon purpureus]KAG0624597.1 hypothetical protein M758_3G259600 [Ceratodon purpureus]
MLLLQLTSFGNRTHLRGFIEISLIDCAVLLQANTEAELPEYLLGTCRLVNLDIAKARWFCFGLLAY